ncbi:MULTISPECIES: hypothetical protein [Shewanella]|uniref:hypothetical protein n=1 Tax=Shewanella TaxID=22 RepID=UPI00163D9ADB|nr:MULTISPECIES: hypothetical protein [Shewanella]
MLEPRAIIDSDLLPLLSSRTRSGIQLLSLDSKQWIPVNKNAGMTIVKHAGKTN